MFPVTATRADDSKRAPGGFFDRKMDSNFFPPEPAKPVVTTTTTTTSSSTTTTTLIQQPKKEATVEPERDLSNERELMKKQLNALKHGAPGSAEEQKQAIEFFRKTIDRSGGVPSKDQIVPPVNSSPSTPSSASSAVAKLPTTLKPARPKDLFVSVIVADDPPSHLQSVLTQLQQLESKKNIPIGEVIVAQVAKAAESSSSRAKTESAVKRFVEKTLTTVKSDRARAVDEAGEGSMKLLNSIAVQSANEDNIPKSLARNKDIDLTPLLSHLGSTVSPTWIIRKGFVDHVYPGNIDVDSLFDSQGNFIGEASK